MNAPLKSSRPRLCSSRNSDSTDALAPSDTNTTVSPPTNASVPGSALRHRHLLAGGRAGHEADVAGQQRQDARATGTRRAPRRT